MLLDSTRSAALQVQLNKEDDEDAWTCSGRSCGVAARLPWAW